MESKSRCEMIRFVQNHGELNILYLSLVHDGARLLGGRRSVLISKALVAILSHVDAAVRSQLTTVLGQPLFIAKSFVVIDHPLQLSLITLWMASSLLLSNLRCLATVWLKARTSKS